MTLTDRMRRAALGVCPTAPAQLRQWLRLVLDIDIAADSAPLAYLWHALHEPEGGKRDTVVWACRGGGKTFYAAVATVLDLLLKPGIEVKLLGGSAEQSQRMHAHLARLLERPALQPLIDGRITDKRARLLSGSVAEILAQSHTSVRGARPQKLRCDEVELFDPDVWAAAQLCTRSATLGGRTVHGSVEAFSTCHQPFGLMNALLARSLPPDQPHHGEPILFKWGVVDVLERCPKPRPCDQCALWPECAGRAKRTRGHITIDDALRMKSRVSAADWASEMLCLQPRRTDCVFPEFDPAAHIQPFDLPLREPPGHMWLGGMDFGFRAPTVFLWSLHEPGPHGGLLRVVDEHALSGVILSEHIRAIRSRPWPIPAWVGIDPAGHQIDGQTGTTNASILKKHGLCCRSRASDIDLGLRLIRARLQPAEGPPRLLIHPRCTHLIEAITSYHYLPGNLTTTHPVKDGHDHAVDALRYLILNLDAPFKTTISNYMTGHST